MVCFLFIKAFFFVFSISSVFAMQQQEDMDYIDWLIENVTHDESDDALHQLVQQILDANHQTEEFLLKREGQEEHPKKLIKQ